MADSTTTDNTLSGLGTCGLSTTPHTPTDTYCMGTWKPLASVAPLAEASGQTRLFDTPTEYFGHPRFYEIMEELKRLHSDKNKQYASKGDPLSNFRRTGQMISKMLKPGINPTLASALSLVSKQIDAIYDIVGEGKEGTVESLRDKLRDVAVYSVIAMVIIEETPRG